MFNRILVPSDFSAPSDAALDYARILAARFESSLQILHVVDDSTAESEFVADGFAPSTEQIRYGLRDQARRRLDALLTQTDRSRYRAHTEAIIGLPAHTIVDYAMATASGLIVMGTHGRTGLAHLLMGSVAEQVIRTAPCPVLTVRQIATADEQAHAVAFDSARVTLPIPIVI